jgi:hypothetical protein
MATDGLSDDLLANVRDVVDGKINPTILPD